MFAILKQPPVKQAAPCQLLNDQIASVQQLSLKIMIANIFDDWSEVRLSCRTIRTLLADEMQVPSEREVTH